MEEQRQEQEIPPRLLWVGKIIRVFVFGLLAVAITKGIDRFGNREDIGAMKSYQLQMTESLNGLRPLQLYHLYVAAMGYETFIDLKDPEKYPAASSQCEDAADQALRAYLASHPREVTLSVRKNKHFECQPKASVLIPLLPELDQFLKSQIVPETGCLLADQAASVAKSQCIQDMSKSIALWTKDVSKWLSGSNGGGGSFQLVIWALMPIVALVDVIWHNFLAYSSFTVVHWVLLAAGLWGTFRLLLRDSGDVGLNGGLFILALFPVLAVGIASLIAEVLYYCAMSGLIVFGGALDFAAKALACTGAYMYIQFFYLSSLKAGEHAAKGRAERAIDVVVNWLFRK